MSDDQIADLARYRDLMLEANARFNLTAIRDREGVDFRLILESLRLAPFVQEATSMASATARMVDIGAGAGIPGVPLAIVFPEIDVSLIDATGKKVRFIESAITSLSLSNCQAVHGRAEELGRLPDWRETHDLAIARAVGSLPTLLELSMPLLRTGARAIFPKGILPAEEVDAAHRAAQMLNAKLLPIVTLDPVEGCPVTQVAQADKMGPITERYPRRPGLPAREPLGG